ncbi:hypothetical protein IMZ11_38605 [Microtetraspora sp. AC03309]|uniref:hypothetical protein n=1 Tax=Microtetraspora sp. AC03309 TaxID=2779376 RepID=UPI001E5FB230|nr:hypothetical protein [Microtetraspora sp. AC03309]MCC5581531.1 hypothetical protein [Microtetraspora sp. AC03309]
MQRITGLLVGAVFGAVFVLVNAQSPLSAVAVTLLRVSACLGAASVLTMWFLTARRVRSAEGRRNMFGRGYLIVVAAEAILIFGGIRVLAALGRPEQANVAWVAFVVGVHFIALAPIWKDWGIAVPGVALTLLGATGLVLASTAAVAWVPFVGGVLPGVALLIGSITFGWRTMAARPA